MGDLLLTYKIEIKLIHAMFTTLKFLIDVNLFDF